MRHMPPHDSHGHDPALCRARRGRLPAALLSPCAALLLLLSGCDASPDAPANGLGSGGAGGAEPACAGAGELCSKSGDARCENGALATCEAVDGCLIWGPAQRCGAEKFCGEGVCRTCESPGTFQLQELEVGGEARTYYLHVPSTVSCEQAAPLWVDFHGTATTTPEEAYNLADQVAIAEREGAILVRPRSRSRVSGEVDVFQWDGAPGDLEANAAFSRALVAHVRSRYWVDSERMVASGFSSGTNMIAQLLGEEGPRFTGYGFVAGGSWTASELRDFESSPARVYSVTGFRDYIHPTWRNMHTRLLDGGLSTEQIFVREADTGHEQYAWHLEELWAWLDRGERPQPTPGGGWQAEMSGANGASLLEAAMQADGSLVVVGTGGTILRRSAAGVWRRVDTPAGGPTLTGVCIDADGIGLAVGDGRLAFTSDGGDSFSFQASPSGFPQAQLAVPYLNASACPGDGRLFAAGYWLALDTPDAGDTFEEVMIPAGSGARAQLAAATTASATGTTIVAGYYDYIGRRTSGAAAFQRIATPQRRAWYTDVFAAPDGSFWITGDRGALYSSVDDGVKWRRHALPTEEDLYAVAALGAGKAVVVVGAHGAVFASSDGGDTWQAAPVGKDIFLGDVAFLGPKTVIAFGEGGAALRRQLF